VKHGGEKSGREKVGKLEIYAKSRRGERHHPGPIRKKKGVNRVAQEGGHSQISRSTGRRREKRSNRTRKKKKKKRSEGQEKRTKHQGPDYVTHAASIRKCAATGTDANPKQRKREKNWVKKVKRKKGKRG